MMTAHFATCTFSMKHIKYHSLLIVLFVLQYHHATGTNLPLIPYNIVPRLVVITWPLSRDKRRHGVGEVELNLKARLVAQLAKHLLENRHPLLQTKWKILSHKNELVSISNIE